MISANIRRTKILDNLRQVSGEVWGATQWILVRMSFIILLPMKWLSSLFVVYCDIGYLFTRIIRNILKSSYCWILFIFQKLAHLVRLVICIFTCQKTSWMEFCTIRMWGLILWCDLFRIEHINLFCWTFIQYFRCREIVPNPVALRFKFYISIYCSFLLFEFEHKIDYSLPFSKIFDL